MKQGKLIVVTPLKNEINNIPKLFEAVANQTIQIALWLIIDDNSTDGSTEMLNSLKNTINTVDTLRICRITNLPNEYQLGSKYSRVVAYGFAEAEKIAAELSLEYDFIGILDADCFPDAHYYENLLAKFSFLPRLGIASGVIYYTKESGLVYDKMPLRFARGGIRVWRAQCLVEAPYQVGYSADAIASAKAWTRGWQSQGFKDSIVYTRVMGARVDSTYYGEAAYKLYMPFYYFLLKVVLFLIKYGKHEAKTFYIGYMRAKKTKTRMNVDNAVQRYFSSLMTRNIIETIIVQRNLNIIKQKL